MTGPTTEKQRYLILDLLRGLALMGIALANFPEFTLWTFLSSDQQGAMTTADVDGAVRYVQFLLVDGKFYSIFSMLFGLGFALILMRHGRRLFVRRMLILMVIGFLHLLFIWSGDILLLYAVSVVPFALAMVCAVCLLYLRRPSAAVFTWLAARHRCAYCRASGCSNLCVRLSSMDCRYSPPVQV